MFIFSLTGNFYPVLERGLSPMILIEGAFNACALVSTRTNDRSETSEAALEKSPGDNLNGERNFSTKSDVRSSSVKISKFSMSAFWISESQTKLSGPELIKCTPV